MTTRMEAIFTRMEANDDSLTEVDLWGQGIGDEGAERIAAALLGNTHVIKLILARNRIGPAGATAVAGALRHNTTLVELNLAGNNIGAAGATAVAGALPLNTTLVKLDLYGNSIGDAGATAVAEALPRNATLVELDLRYNNFGAELDFGRNNFGAAGEKAEVEIERCLERNRNEKRVTKTWKETGCSVELSPFVLGKAGELGCLRTVYGLLREKPDVVHGQPFTSSCKRRKLI